MTNRAIRRRAAASVVALATAAACGGIAAVDRALPRAAPEDAGPHVFLSGKYGEVWRVSAGGDVVHAEVPQLDPGDPPHHLLARGEALLGWGYETYLLDPSLERPPEVLVDDSLFFLPSAHRRRIWVTAEEPGTNRKIASVHEMTLDGAVTVPKVRPPDGRWPEGAVESGLLFAAEGGRLVVWDPTTREVVFHLPPGDLGATHGNRVAWCEHGCRALHVTDVSTGDDRMIAPPPGFDGFHAWHGEFSPDGRTFAVPVVSSTGGGRVHLALVDVEAGTARAVAGTETGGLFNLVAWSAESTHAFFTGSGPSGEREVFVYEASTGAARKIDVSVGDFYDATAI